MDSAGQMQLEAIICIAALFGVVASALSAVNMMAEASEHNAGMLLAEAGVQKCSVAADILYANGGGGITLNENCYGNNEHEVKSAFKDWEKSAFSVAKEITTVQTGNRTLLEVKVDDHYR